MTNRLKIGMAGLVIILGSLLPSTLGGAESIKKTNSLKNFPTAQTQTLTTKHSEEYNHSQRPTFHSNLNPKKEKITYPNPNYEKDDNFISDTDTLLLARAIYGESRGQLDNEKYVWGVAETIKSRLKTTRSLRDVLLQTRIKENKKDSLTSKMDTVYHYTCFDPDDPNYSEIKNPDPRDSSWKNCYNLARKILQGDHNPDSGLEGVTNYFVGEDPKKHLSGKKAKRKGIPSWAYKMDHEGKFELDKTGKRIPIEPTAIVSLNDGKKAYFYSFKYF